MTKKKQMSIMHKIAVYTHGNADMQKLAK